MVSTLGRQVNKPVLVSIPSLLGSEDMHACQLIAVETAGLWLQSAGLTKRTVNNAQVETQAVFVPFTQIVCLVPAPPAVDPEAPAKPRRRTSAAAPSRRRS
jgi:hypothetical protein